MNQIAISKFKQMKVAEIKEQMPFEVTADGEIVAVVRSEMDVPQKIALAAMDKHDEQLARQTKCPNCKFVYPVTEPDGNPPFLSGIRKKN